MSAYVVVISGTAARQIGRIVGPDRRERHRSLVRFAGESFPRDFRSIADDNLRRATEGERALSEAAE